MKETVIKIERLFKSFGERKVLRGIDLELAKTENLVVLGRSGSGKSVLIKVIAGLLKPDSGLVEVLGHKVDELGERDLQALRRRLGFLFQHSALYDSMSVAGEAARRHAMAAYRTALEHPRTSIGGMIIAAALVGGLLWYMFGDERRPVQRRRRTASRVRAGSERRRKHRSAARPASS